MALTADQRRALRSLGDDANGATEELLLAHGFKRELLANLVRDRVAVAERRSMRAGRQPIEVT
jgi:hypothetical protein